MASDSFPSSPAEPRGGKANAAAGVCERIRPPYLHCFLPRTATSGPVGWPECPDALLRYQVRLYSRRTVTAVCYSECYLQHGRRIPCPANGYSWPSPPSPRTWCTSTDPARHSRARPAHLWRLARAVGRCDSVDRALARPGPAPGACRLDRKGNKGTGPSRSWIWAWRATSGATQPHLPCPVALLARGDAEGLFCSSAARVPFHVL